jgi:L-alanine-DL-glutamate epimerase-like enolase superfamily enzyme
LKAQGWKAIKYRSSFPTMKEDIRLVELARKAVGDDFGIMCDGNKATLNYASQKGVPWDFTRALETAKEYQRLKVYWLEEPLPRYDFDGLAELNRLIDKKLAGGEGNRGIHEFRWLLERGCFDIVQPEVMLEGPTHLRKIAVIAESMNKMCIPHVGDSRPKTIRPPQPNEILSASRLRRKARLKFCQISWIILHDTPYYILGSPESSRYPI